MRLIDADALIETLHDMTHHPDGYLTMREIENTVESEPTIGGWISAKDRLPKEDDVYLVYTRTKNIALYWFDNDNGWYDGNDSLCGKTWVTHWAEVPEPPEEVSEDGD